MQQNAYAKINLSLHICEKRSDGLHEVDSLVGFARAADRIILTPAEKTSLHISGPLAQGLAATSDNLVLRAHMAFETHIKQQIPLAYHLEKNLPHSAGIGGGSADAAAVLRGLMAYYTGDIDMHHIYAMAQSLGADIPVSLASRPCHMRGIGEQITPLIRFPACDIILVNPKKAIATADIFRNYNAKARHIAHDIPHRFSRFCDLIRFLRTQTNDLQSAALQFVPEIADIIDALHHAGAALARMSGSGATCFGLCPAGEGDKVAARLALPAHYWICRTQLITV